jgi:hypothetical protein
MTERDWAAERKAKEDQMRGPPGEYYITIGDWSEDGHNHYTVFAYQANKPRVDQQAAYLRSVKKTGIRFSHENAINDPHMVCSEYKDSLVTSYQMELLRRHAQVDRTHMIANGRNGFYPSEKELADMILWFIGVSLPGFEYSGLRPIKIALWDSEEKYNNAGPWIDTNGSAHLNGWWNKNGKMNCQFGYGLYEGNKFTDTPRLSTWDGNGLLLLKKKAANYGLVIYDYGHEWKLPKSFANNFKWQYGSHQGAIEEIIPIIGQFKNWFWFNGFDGILVYDRIYFKTRKQRDLFRKEYPIFLENVEKEAIKV